jgi:hypothetical protein
MWNSLFEIMADSSIVMLCQDIEHVKHFAIQALALGQRPFFEGFLPLCTSCARNLPRYNSDACCSVARTSGRFRGGDADVPDTRRIVQQQPLVIDKVRLVG